MGGQADTVAAYLKEHYTEGASLDEALKVAVAALGHSADNEGSQDRVIPAEDLEVAVLDRTRTQPRKFGRLRPSRLDDLLGERGPGTHAEPEQLNAPDSEAPPATSRPSRRRPDPAGRAARRCGLVTNRMSQPLNHAVGDQTATLCRPQPSWAAGSSTGPAVGRFCPHPRVHPQGHERRRR